MNLTQPNKQFNINVYKFSAKKGFWNDINCGLELPSICKRSSDFVNTTSAPTTIPTGGCSPGWIPFRGKVMIAITHFNQDKDLLILDLIYILKCTKNCPAQICVPIFSH